MKITEILVENQSLDELNVGRGIEKVAGGIGKAAGYIAGIPGGLKKAFQKGKARATAGIGGEMPDEPTQSNPDFDKEYSRLTGKGSAAQPAPTSGPGSSTAGTTAAGGAKTEPDLNAPAGAAKPAAPAQAPSATDINKAGPKGTAPAKPVQGATAKQAMAKTAQAMGSQTADQAGQTLYAQVKSQVNQLDKKGKQRILQLLQKSMAQPAAAPAAAPGTKPAAAPAAKTAATAADKAKPAAAGKKPAPKQAGKPSQAEIDADRERLMGMTSDSVIRKGTAVTESKKFHSLYKK